MRIVSPFRDLAVELGSAEGAARVAVHRMRRRLGELLRAEIAETVAEPGEVDAELQFLMSVLQGAGVRRAAAKSQRARPRACARLG
jgi:hypothetical protein